ncbi:MAG TPA: alpha/beta hydrolase [Candidatus Acidoferrales bacterium]|nr:alpha/beta hydrolase [Candidatus Acidoferrales bacterium]
MSRPPHLLLLPGLVCDADVWKHQASSLAKFTTVEIADYGPSESIGEMASVALAHAPDRFAVAGHSMGGRVAFEMIRRVPERVAGLAVLDTAYKALADGDAGESEKARRFALLDLARSQGMRAMVRQWMKGIIPPERLDDKPLTDAIVEMMARKSPEIFAAQIKALLERPDATAVLSAVRCPAMVLCGREDTWSPVEGHREMVALIPQSKLVVIENCGHMAPMERPEEVTAALATWFSRL